MFTFTSKDESYPVNRIVESTTRTTKNGRPFQHYRVYDLVIQHLDEARCETDHQERWILAGHWRDDQKRQEAEVECLVLTQTWFLQDGLQFSLILIGSPLSKQLYTVPTFHTASHNIFRLCENLVECIINAECSGQYPDYSALIVPERPGASGVSNSHLQCDDIYCPAWQGAPRGCNEEKRPATCYKKSRDDAGSIPLPVACTGCRLGKNGECTHPLPGGVIRPVCWRPE